MKVNVNHNYFDTQLERIVKVNETLDVTPDRAKQLVNAGVCTQVEVATTTPEVVTKSVPKKKATKKSED